MTSIQHATGELIDSFFDAANNPAAMTARCNIYFTTVQSTDIYTVDTVLPIHIVWHGEATAKSTTKHGRRQFTLKRATLLLRSIAER